MKRTITLEDGRELQISEESYNELQKAVKPKVEYLDDTWKEENSSFYEISLCKDLNNLPYGWTEVKLASFGSDYRYFVNTNYNKFIRRVKK